MLPPLLPLPPLLCLQDAAIRGWFRTSRSRLTGAPHLRVIGLTALEIAAAMQHLHTKNVLHGVRLLALLILSRVVSLVLTGLVNVMRRICCWFDGVCQDRCTG
jgi:hypothetical protein